MLTAEHARQTARLAGCSPDDRQRVIELGPAERADGLLNRAWIRDDVDEDGRGVDDGENGSACHGSSFANCGNIAFGSAAAFGAVRQNELAAG
jgi:hypothetical protein